MTVSTSTLRPGLLVGLKTSVVGNVSYRTRDIDPDHVTPEGERHATWETERTIVDPKEHDAAIKCRSKVRSLITGVCAQSAFGLLCPEASSDKLKDAIAEARAVADKFNSGSSLSRIQFNVIVGRVAADDVEAIRAINSEVRDLLGQMEAGIANVDVKVIRDAANKARSVGSMLSPSASARVQEAIETARASARKIVQAGETAARVVDSEAIAALKRARTEFLDLDPETEVLAPVTQGRALDLAPIEEAPLVSSTPAFQLEV